MDTLEQRVTALERDMDVVKGALVTRDEFEVIKLIERRQQKHSQDLHDLRETQVAHGHDIAELKAGQQALREDVGILKSDVGTLKSDVGTLKQGQEAILLKLDQLIDRDQPS